MSSLTTSCRQRSPTLPTHIYCILDKHLATTTAGRYQFPSCSPSCVGEARILNFSDVKRVYTTLCMNRKHYEQHWISLTKNLWEVLSVIPAASQSNICKRYSLHSKSHIYNKSEVNNFVFSIFLVSIFKFTNFIKWETISFSFVLQIYIYLSINIYCRNIYTLVFMFITLKSTFRLWTILHCIDRRLLQPVIFDRWQALHILLLKTAAATRLENRKSVCHGSDYSGKHEL